MTIISKNLKKLMDAHPRINGNQNELARQTGVGQPAIQRILGGHVREPKLSTIKPILDFFGVSMDQLRGEGELPLEALRSIHVDYSLSAEEIDSIIETAVIFGQLSGQGKSVDALVKAVKIYESLDKISRPKSTAQILQFIRAVT